MIFATFIAFGIIVSMLLGRAGDGVGRIYFADLVGAGLGCLLAIPLITRLGPPRVIMLAALIFAVVGLASCRAEVGAVRRSPALTSVVLVVHGRRGAASLPDVRTEDGSCTRRSTLYSAWGPVFRVDVVQLGPTTTNYLLVHDGTFGSGDPTSSTATRRSLGRLRQGPARDPVQGARHAAAARADHRIGRRQRDPRVARTSTRPNIEARRAEPGHGLAAHRTTSPTTPATSTNGPTCTCTTATAAPTSRAHKHEVQPRLVRRARQLRGDQRGVVGRVRAVGELPLHEAR